MATIIKSHPSTEYVDLEGKPLPQDARIIPDNWVQTFTIVLRGNSPIPSTKIVSQLQMRYEVVSLEEKHRLCVARDATIRPIGAKA